MAGAPVNHEAPSPLDGTWDLTWQTRHGPERSGYLVIRSAGDRANAEIHGKGAVKAFGTISGNGFQRRGARMLVPYTLTGTWSGNSMQGELKVLSVDKRFTGQRRPGN